MKKYLFFLFFCLILPLFFSSCSKNNIKNEDILNIELVSPKENLIGVKNQFQWDSIWFDLYYQDDTIQRIVATEEMLSSQDRNKIKDTIGETTVTFHIANAKKKLTLYLYDETYLQNNPVYIAHTNDSIYVYSPTASSMVDEDYRFYNWYLDSSNLIKVTGDETGIVHIYSNLSINPKYRVRFFHQDVLVKEEYVEHGKSAHPPVMLSLDDYNFCGWSDNYANVTRDLDLYSIYFEGVYVVNFFDKDNQLLSTQIVKPGDNAVPPTDIYQNEDYIFYGWSDDYLHIMESKDIFPIYKEKNKRVRVYITSQVDDINEVYLYSILWEDKKEFIFDKQKLEQMNLKFDISMYEFWIRDYHEAGVIQVEMFPKSIQLYRNDVLFQEITPSLYEQHNIKPTSSGYWKQSSTDPFRYDFIQYKKYGLYDHIYLNHDGIKEDIELAYFLSDPMFYLAIQNQDYIFYEWYWDPLFTQKIDDFTKLKSADQIYGRSFKPTLVHERYCFEKVDGGYYMKLKNPKEHLSSMLIRNTNLCIPEYYKGEPVVQVDFSVLKTAEYCFLPKTLHYIVETSKYNNYSGIFVDDDNPFYKYNEEYFYEERDGIKTILDFHLGFIAEFHMKKNFRIAYRAFHSTTFEQFYVDEGIEEICINNLKCKTLYLPASLKKVIFDPSWPVLIEEIVLTNEETKSILDEKLQERIVK